MVARDRLRDRGRARIEPGGDPVGHAGAARDVDGADAELGEPRQQPGAEQRGLAGTGGADVDHDPAEDHVLEQPRDLAVPAVELVPAGLVERRDVPERRPARAREDADRPAAQRGGHLLGGGEALLGAARDRAQDDRAYLAVLDVAHELGRRPPGDLRAWGEHRRDHEAGRV